MQEHKEHECKHTHADHQHSHTHDISNVSEKRLFWVILLNIIITISQIIGGIISGSLALISDALHNLSDVIAIVISYFAIKIGKKPKNKNNTFGYKRAEILAAFINSLVLMGISVYLLVEAYHKFIRPESVNGAIVIVVALIGFVANFISMKLLMNKGEKNINIKSAYLHMLSDMLSSLAVIVAGVVIYIWHIYWIDTVLTVLIALYIIRETLGIINRTMAILMQSTPERISIDELVNEIQKVENVDDVHHVHFWCMTEDELFFEAHVNVKYDIKVSETVKILEEIKKVVAMYSVKHVTIQFEMGCCEKLDIISKDCNC
ncbi:MAG TPA: cation transporter [Clostridiales bacterium]|nr:MAG: cobalt transporter [Clostridiales bacterium GWD2_32_19]HCC07172.1 cation transporter [Clostridiales bacterium]